MIRKYLKCRQKLTGDLLIFPYFVYGTSSPVAAESLGQVVS